MSLNYKTYDFIGNALTESEFLNLKMAFQTDRFAVEELYKVHYWQEIFREFKFSFLLLIISGLAITLLLLFLSNSSEWLITIFTVISLAIVLYAISIIISLINFLSYLDNKKTFGKLHLYLLETCPDFKSYMKTYLNN